MDRRDFLRSVGATSLLPLLAACGAGEETVFTVGTSLSGGSLPTGGSDSMPPLKASAATDWSGDPFALGSYSHLRPGGEPRHRTALAAPEGERLFFAGEATSTEFPSTVHGAFESGRRAAGEVDEVLGGAGTVVVIGAGASGVAAAHSLSESGYGVTVVEGRDRVGGRVWTTSLEGTPFDLGASWIHGIRGNLLTDLADDAGVDLVATDYESVRLFDPSGSEVSNRVYRQIDDLIKDLNGLDGDSDDSIGELLLEAGYDPSDPIHRWVVASVIEHEFAEDVADLGYAAAIEGDEFRGGDVVIPAGYWRLFDRLVSSLDVRTGFVVEAVAHDGASVTVSGGADVITADAAVVTLPVGVLAAGSVDFMPGLSEDKREALELVGMGVLDKMVLMFDSAFWDTETHVFGYVSASGEWAEWVNLAAVTGVPALMGFNAGSVARELAATGSDEVIRSALDVATAMLG